jgi:hypothetical protein
VWPGAAPCWPPARCAFRRSRASCASCGTIGGTRTGRAVTWAGSVRRC